MSLRDPFTGQIDFDELMRYGIILLIICVFASAAAASEGLGVLYPYESLAKPTFRYISEHYNRIIYGSDNGVLVV